MLGSHSSVSLWQGASEPAGRKQDRYSQRESVCSRAPLFLLVRVSDVDLTSRTQTHHTQNTRVGSAFAIAYLRKLKAESLQMGSLKLWPLEDETLVLKLVSVFHMGPHQSAYGCFSPGATAISRIMPPRVVFPTGLPRW